MPSWLVEQLNLLDFYLFQALCLECNTQFYWREREREREKLFGSPSNIE
jgi:hypothetical protein